jgi:signal transduction histidine kinase
MARTPANILIVDDDPGPRESLRVVLQEDYNVTCAATGPQALQVIKSRPIDLVTLDLRLPGLDGIDVLREIKALDPNIEVIIVTGFGDLHSAVESIRHGVSEYVVKPFNIAEIKMAVAKSLDRRRLNTELARFFRALEADEAERPRARNPKEDLSRLLQEVPIQEALNDTINLRKQMIRTERLSTIGLMTAGFIHEINNPLASVVALAELCLARMRNSERDVPDVEVSLEKIVTESKRISRLAARMLSAAREHPKGSEPSEPAAIIDEATQLVKPQIARKGLKLDWERPAALPEAPCGADQLKQVMLNLLINAVQATPQGGTVRVAASFHLPDPRGAKEPAHLTIVVSDTGGGIPPEHRARIFEPFFTTKKAGEGTGLGLYICRQIIERCGGSLAVESAPGRGTTFTITLPTA